MTDVKIRELERRWKQSSSVEDEVALLQERIRAGDLTAERVELAAYCGSEAANGIFPQVAPRFLQAWIYGLERWGPQALLRAGSAAAGLAVEVFASEHPAAHLVASRLAFVRARIKGQHAQDPGQWAPELPPRPQPEDDWTDIEEARVAVCSEESFAAARCVDLLAKIVLEDRTDGGQVAGVAVNALDALGECESELLAAMRADLVFWALESIDARPRAQ